MKKLFSLLIIISTIRLAAQPANNNCVNATNLTVNNPLICNQNMAGSNLQANECTINYGAGTTGASVWYSFTATQASMVLNYLTTNIPGCYPCIQVYGPFASVAAGCATAGVFGVPCGGAPAYNFVTLSNYQGTEYASFLYSNGDPGNHPRLQGLIPGSVYLIRIQSSTGGPCGATLPNFCISVATVAVNAAPPTASVINACGVTFTGTTNGGYYNNGGENGGGFGNLDNCATTCPSCATPGDDVPFVINNISWYTFCASTAGTWNVQFSVSNCVLPAPNNGAQIAVFSGPPCSWTQVWQSPNSCSALGNGQVPNGCSVTSSNFNVAAGACAYMCVDGFAGDACNYSIVLTNVSGGCNLPVELTGFNSRCEKGRLVFEWETATEKNSDYFTIEKSFDGITFFPVGEVKAAGNSTNTKRYIFSLKESSEELAYYRLSETDIDGTVKTFNTNAVRGCDPGQKFVSWATGNQINISVTSKLAGNYKVELYDLAGHLIIAKEQSYSVGNSISTIPVDSESGIYFLRIIGDDENQSKKIFIQK